MKQKDLFYGKRPSWLDYCPLLDSVDKDLICIIKDAYRPVNLKDLTTLTAMSKNTVKGSLYILTATKVIKKLGNRYYFNENRSEYILPAVTLKIIGEYERILGVKETFMPNSLRSPDAALKLVEKAVKGYIRMNAKSFVKKYEAKEIFCIQYLQTLEARKDKNTAPQQSLPQEPNIPFMK